MRGQHPRHQTQIMKSPPFKPINSHNLRCQPQYVVSNCNVEFQSSTVALKIHGLLDATHVIIKVWASAR
jgi:hypothetical protein